MNVHRIGVGAFLAFIGGFGLLAILYAAFQTNQHREFLDENYKEKRASEATEGQDIALTETKNGRPKWQLKVKKITYNSTNTEAQMKQINGTLFDDAGKPLLLFDAPEGRFFKENSRIELTKKASLSSPASKIVITAPHVTWSSLKDEIVAQGGIQLSKADFGTSTAQQAIFAMDMSKVQLIGNASSQIGH